MNLSIIIITASVSITALLLIFLLLSVSRQKKISLKNSELDIENKKLLIDINLKNQKIGFYEDLNNQLSEEKNRTIKLKEYIRELETRLENEEKNIKEKTEFLSQSKDILKKEFENLATEIIENKEKKLSSQNNENLKSILQPFREQVSGFQKKLEENHINQAKDSAVLKQEISQLKEMNIKITKEASNLTEALKGSQKTQGNWGEMILETVLDNSGLEKGREYQREVSFTEKDSRKRPDAIIYLPEDRHFVVDAKVSIIAYTKYVEAETKEEKETYLKEHIQSVRNHIDTLHKKDYQSITGLNTPDMVFMFMPIEPAFFAAFKNNDSLFQEAFEKRVVVVTPTTLLACLRTVSNLWRLEKQNQSARELSIHAQKVYEKLQVFLSHMDNIGKQVERLGETYEKSVKSLCLGKGNLVSLATKFKDYGVDTKKDIPETFLNREKAASLIAHDDNE